MSFPDINSLPKLAEVFEIFVDELMQTQVTTNENKNKEKISEIVDIVLKGLGVAMGIAVTVLSVLEQLEINTAFIMLGIGLESISVFLLKDKH